MTGLDLTHYFANKCPSSQGCGFSSGHVWMWELDYKESWAPKNWCFWTVVLEETLESPLDCKEIQSVHPKGDQSWVFIGRTDVEAETPVLWPPDVKNWLIWKDPDAGKDWSGEEKGMIEDEMVGWHQLFFQGVSVSLFHGCRHYLQWFWSPQKKVCHCFHCFPIYLPWSDGTRCHDLSFLNVEL